MRHHADSAGGEICLRGVVLPDEGIRVCDVRHHAGRAGGVIWVEGVVLPDEEIRVCGG